MLTERVEQKFFVAPSRIGTALALLRRTCRWDGGYPQEQITSLYFDTADLEEHERSLAGDYSKDKVRVRWYGTEHGENVPVWLELKSRRGFASTKQRRALQVPAAAVAIDALSRGIVPAGTLLQTMAGFGFVCSKRLQPVIVVSYWRYRFVEPRSGLRVALDTRVGSTMIMPGRGLGERNLQLAGAVVEVKGPSIELPASLRLLGEVGSSWTRYSKYSSSLEAHAAELGTVSRLWPAGTVHAEPCTGAPKPNREVATCGSN